MTEIDNDSLSSEFIDSLFTDLTIICFRCGKERPISEFCKYRVCSTCRKNLEIINKSKKTGIDPILLSIIPFVEKYNRRPYVYDWSAYKELNIEKIKAKDRAYRELNIEKIKAYDRAYYHKNKEKIRPQKLEYLKRYCKEHKDKYRSYRHRRRAIKRQVPHEDWSDFEGEIRSQKQVICYWCGRPTLADGSHCHMAHIVPITKHHGPDIKSNIAPACASCNVSQGNRHPIVYLRWRFNMKLSIHPQFFDNNGNFKLPIHFDGGDSYDYKIKD